MRVPARSGRWLALRKLVFGAAPDRLLAHNRLLASPSPIHRRSECRGRGSHIGPRLSLSSSIHFLFLSSHTFSFLPSFTSFVLVVSSSFLLVMYDKHKQIMHDIHIIFVTQRYQFTSWAHFILHILIREIGWIFRDKLVLKCFSINDLFSVNTNG